MRGKYVRAGLAALAAVVTFTAAPAMAAALPHDGADVAKPERHAAIIGGRVVDTERHPVPNATVRLFTEDGRLLQQTHSNNRGLFRFRPVRQGVYIIRAAHDRVGRGHARFNTRGDRHRVLIVLE